MAYVYTSGWVFTFMFCFFFFFFGLLLIVPTIWDLASELALGLLRASNGIASCWRLLCRQFLYTAISKTSNQHKHVYQMPVLVQYSRRLGEAARNCGRSHLRYIDDVHEALIPRSLPYKGQVVLLSRCSNQISVLGI